VGKSFEEIVSNYSTPEPEWQVFVNGSEYTSNVNSIEFERSVNNPIKFVVKTSGISGRESDISRGQEIVVSYSGFELFRGVLQQVDAETGVNATIKGSGYSSELDGNVSSKFSSTDVSSIVNDLIDGTTVPNDRVFSTSFSNATVNVEDFRANTNQLEDVNRLLGEFDLEWFTSFDSDDNPVFNVTFQIQNDDNGKPLDTFSTSGPGQNAEVIKRNTNRNKGNFDGILVRGYGDGEDQITATAGNTGSDSRVLIYTDKSIITESEAQNRADSLQSERTVEWREIRVKPSEPTQLFGLGDLLKVDSEDAKLNDNYRVVETYYKIDLNADDVSATLMLSNRPQTFVNSFKTEQAKRRGQTDHMQGSSNTINESNKEVSSSTSGTKIEFNVPERFVTDTAGNTRVKDARLDFSVDNYKRLIQASDAKGIDDSTKFVDTTVTDFGDVERVNTEPKPRGDVDETLADFRQTDTTTSGAGGSYIQSASNSSSQAFATEGVDLNLAEVDAGTASSQGAIIVTHLFVTPSSNLELDDAGDQTIISYDFRVEDEGGNIVVPELQSVARTTHVAKFIQKKSYTLLNFDDSPDTSETQTLNFDLNLDSIPHINLVDLDGSEGADVFIDDNNLSSDEVDVTVENSNLGSGHDVGVEVASTDNPKVEPESEDIVLTHRIPEDTDNREYTPVVNPSNDCFIGSNVSLYVEDEHIHQLPDTSEGADNVQAYTAKPDGTGGETDIDAGDGASQSDDEVPNQDTFTFGQLDSNELILSKKQTNAGQLTVKVNGTEIAASPFILSGSPPFIQRDIDLSGEIDSAGSFTVELIPDEKAAVKGNVIIDHKKDEDQ